MTGAAVLAVLWPLGRRAARLAAPGEVAVYRDQLEEVRRDRAAGQIGEAEAAAAEREISRRLLAAADANAADTADTPMLAPPRRRRVAAVAILVLLPICAGAVYLALGSPSLPDQPLAERLAASRAGPSIQGLIAQVEAHLERQPDDGRGWEVIAPIYLRLGRFDEAVKARRNALRLNGETAERQAALGEALVFAANGVVTGEARAAFDRALALDPAHVQAAYFTGLAAEQDGDRTRANEIWGALLASAPPDAPWVEFVRRAVEGVDTDAERPAGAEQMAASPAPKPDQRNPMIRGMVERLAQRLQREGSDPEGWVRLIRSYVVLGEPEKAHAAAADARRALASEPAKLQQFEDQVKALDLAQRAPDAGQTASLPAPKPDQRDPMIRGMVERLAQRLQHEGSDPEGWVRLIRSYVVLGEPEKARAAASDARRALASEPAKLQQFEDQVKALGLQG
jgi:cytochrome c-type biogenesis protein CcmH